MMILFFLFPLFGTVVDSHTDNPADQDGDGVTTVEEFATYASERLGGLDAEELADLADRVDVDGDGEISDDEFADRMAAIRGGAAPDESDSTDEIPAAIGSWRVEAGEPGNTVSARIDVRARGRGLRGELVRTDAVYALRRVRFEDGRLTFQAGGPALQFTGSIEGDAIEGSFVHPFGSVPCTGHRMNEERMALARIVEGAWDMETEMGESPVPAVMDLTIDVDGFLAGTWSSMDRVMDLDDIEFDGETLMFLREPQPGFEIPFEAEFEGGTWEGFHDLNGETIPCTGERAKSESRPSPFTPPDPNVIPEWAKAEDDATFFDALESEFGERAFRAVGRDEFHVLDHPKMVHADEADLVQDDDYVVGISIGGEAKAYPVSPLDSSELANDTCGGIPIAASW